MYVIHEMLFQRIMASHLQNPLPLPPVNDLTCIVTGSTSGIGSEIARFFFLFSFISFFSLYTMQSLNLPTTLDLFRIQFSMGFAFLDLLNAICGKKF